MANKELPFSIQAQSQNQWCWAAIAASISQYYDNNSTWTQCQVACVCLGSQECCQNIVPNPCDTHWYLDRALRVTNNLFGDIINRPISETDIMTQIDNGQIIGVRIGWFGGGGHFVSIYGYNSDSTEFFVYVGNPDDDNSIQNLDNFTNNYQGAGSWTHSYLTNSIIGGSHMLQFSTINENIVQQAKLLNHELFLSEKGQVSPIQEGAALAIPHSVYTIPFQFLTDDSDNDLHTRAGGYRVVDSSENGKQKIYNFSDNKPGARILEIIPNDTFNKKYRDVLNKIEQSQKNVCDVFSLNIIRQPELKIKAFWLHSTEHPGTDTFIPVITSSILDKNKIYDSVTFIKELKKAAKARKSYDNNLLGG